MISTIKKIRTYVTIEDMAVCQIRLMLWKILLSFLPYNFFKIVYFHYLYNIKAKMFK